MAMNSVETLRTVSYSANVALALQVSTSKLAHRAQQFSMTGKKVELEDQFGQTSKQRKDTRFGPTKVSTLGISRRWMAKPREFYFNHLIDNDDTLETAIDVKGGYTASGARTIIRGTEEEWLLGFYGTNLTGEDGSTSTPFSAGNVLPVTTGGAGAGLTLEKLIAAREKLAANLVDLEAEKPIVVITAKQQSDLLKQVKLQSSDYNPQDRAVLQEGKVISFMGFEFIEMEYGNAVAFPESAPLSLDGAGDRRVPVFVPSGMAVNTWQSNRSFVVQRPDLEFAWQVFAGRTLGACRMMEEKCLQIMCTET